MIYASTSTNGEPRLRVELVLRVKPEVLERLATQGEEGLLELGARLESAVSVDTDDVEVLSESKVTYRETPQADPSAMLREMMDRLPLPKREPWEEPPA